MAADVERRCVYYSKARAIAFGIFGVFVVFVYLAALPTAISAPHNTANLVLGSVLFVAAIIAIVRWIRCVVIADGDGVTVRNPLRTYRIAWADVYGIDQGFFSYGSGGGIATGRIVQIALSPTRNIRAHALATYVTLSRRNPTRYADRVIKELSQRAARNKNNPTGRHN